MPRITSTPTDAPRSAPTPTSETTSTAYKPGVGDSTPENKDWRTKVEAEKAALIKELKRSGLDDRQIAKRVEEWSRRMDPNVAPLQGPAATITHELYQDNAGNITGRVVQIELTHAIDKPPPGGVGHPQLAIMGSGKAMLADRMTWQWNQRGPERSRPDWKAVQWVPLPIMDGANQIYGCINANKPMEFCLRSGSDDKPVFFGPYDASRMPRLVVVGGGGGLPPGAEKAWGVADKNVVFYGNMPDPPDPPAAEKEALLTRAVSAMKEGAVQSTYLDIAARSFSESPRVLDEMREADVLVQTGGDQAVRLDVHKNDKGWSQALQNEEANGAVRGVHTAGWSAGAATKGEEAYPARLPSMDSPTALKDPTNPDLALVRSAQAQPELGANVLVDTHFGQRGRLGRALVFGALMLEEQSKQGVQKPQATVIGLDEATELAVDTHVQPPTYAIRGKPDESSVWLIRMTGDPVLKDGEPLDLKGVTVEMLELKPGSSGEWPVDWSKHAKDIVRVDAFDETVRVMPQSTQGLSAAEKTARKKLEERVAWMNVHSADRQDYELITDSKGRLLADVK